MAWLCISRIQLPQSSYRAARHIISSSAQNESDVNHQHHPGLVWKSAVTVCFFWPVLVARNSQDVTRSALGEVWLRLVDLGLDDDRALPPAHAALDRARDVHLQLPLLTAERNEKMEIH